MHPPVVVLGGSYPTGLEGGKAPCGFPPDSLRLSIPLMKKTAQPLHDLMRTHFLGFVNPASVQSPSGRNLARRQSFLAHFRDQIFFPRHLLSRKQRKRRIAPGSFSAHGTSKPWGQHKGVSCLEGTHRNGGSPKTRLYPPVNGSRPTWTCLLTQEWARPASGSSGNTGAR